MRENLTYGLMWQGVETASFDARRHLLTLPADSDRRLWKKADSAETWHAIRAIFSAALKEYVARHAPDEVTEAMNRVCDEVGDRPEPFVAAAGRRVLENIEW